MRNYRACRTGAWRASSGDAAADADWPLAYEPLYLIINILLMANALKTLENLRITRDKACHLIDACGDS